MLTLAGGAWAKGRYLVELGVQGAAELHVLDEVGALALVGGDDANLIGLGTGLQQPGGDLLHVGRLRPLKITQSVMMLVQNNSLNDIEGLVTGCILNVTQLPTGRA